MSEQTSESQTPPTSPTGEPNTTPNPELVKALAAIEALKKENEVTKVELEKFNATEEENKRREQELREKEFKASRKALLLDLEKLAPKMAKKYANSTLDRIKDAIEDAKELKGINPEFSEGATPTNPKSKEPIGYDRVNKKLVYE